MTAFNMVLEPQRVCIAMDSLVVRQGYPWRYCAKILLLPQLGGVMCGTGVLRFVLDWFVQLQSDVLAPNMVALDPKVSLALRLLARQHYLDEQNTTTIYHFGFDEARQRFRGFAYRSARGFGSEELAYGWHTKPAAELGPGRALPTTFIELMERQKAEDRTLPPRERVGIGGDIHFLVMTPGHYELSHCHRFGDYATDYGAMLDQ